MGSILDISCSECNYKNEFFLGAGEFFKDSKIKSIAVVNRLTGIDKNKILIEDYSVQIYRCFECNCLYNKMEIIFKIEDNLPALYNIYYECCKYRLPLYPIFNSNVFCSPSEYGSKSNSTDGFKFRNDYESDYYKNVLKDIPCYQCGKRSIYLKGRGIFD